ncbi:winged helix-turn-helix domain-containing protein [Rheinheimera sp.]|uniref:winged helix-turn-helix domain-containing protein n=1 Tax=Rheinheimera sp. TaxID=1869214 RepID=UPI002352DFAA|nr:winged helix-turn-helix domain-containing protein [Rheinheimera sp.]
MAENFRYQQLTQQLQQLLAQGHWQPAERLPSVRALCKQYQLSLATVQHALHQLEALGLVEARARSGYYVRQPLSAVSATKPEPPPPARHR